MDFFEAQDFMKKMYPDKAITFEFDEKCQRLHELVYTDGIPNEIHHIQCEQIKATVDGMEPFYIPIKPHRLSVSWDFMKSMLSSKFARDQPKVAQDQSKPMLESNEVV